MIKAWLSAFRLRTLPLALASIGMGSFLAAARAQYQVTVLLLCAGTTIFLQILSNLANDYGDSIHGADSLEREGPARAVQSGRITAKAMKVAMLVFVILSLASGLALLYVAFYESTQSWTLFLYFLGLGILSIIAAITYTAGKKPYGYAGLGDIAVLLFFGWVGVLGTYFLHTLQFDWLLLLPATSCGLLAVAVLNVNNIRDIQSDLKAGKKSIPVRLGRDKAVLYHWLVLIVALVCSLVYVMVTYRGWVQLLFLVTIPLLSKNAWAIQHKKRSAELDPYLKQMALTTLLFVLTFGIGQLWG